MQTLNRTFTIVESGKPASAVNIRVPTTDIVEVIDLTTKVVLQVKAADVSIYRHTLRMNGKIFNIMSVRDSW
jgi:hypothetical protein